MLPVSLVAPQTQCLFCHGTHLWISQHRERTIIGLEKTLCLTMRDKKCISSACPQPQVRYRDPQESFFAPPESHFGLDLILEIGRLRFSKAMSFKSIHEDLQVRNVPISLMGVQYQCRKYQDIVACQVSPFSEAIIQKLKKRGFILPVIDAVHYGEGEAVVYLIIDSFSGLPLFGWETLVRGRVDLVPFIAQLKSLNLPILGIVSDKESGLAPAIAEALPGVLHQFCQRHYLSNVAKPMEKGLADLGKIIREKEEKLREFERKIIRLETKLKSEGKTPPADLEIARDLCGAARTAARRHGRNLTDPPALKRHTEIKRVERAVKQANRKKGGIGNI